MRYPSGSKFGLAAKCTHPFNSGLKWTYDSGSYAQYGKGLHLASLNYVLGIDESSGEIGEQFDLSQDDCDRLFAERELVEQHIDALRADGYTVEAEVALALDLNTMRARRLEQRLDQKGRPRERDYKDKRSGEMALTLDLVAFKEGSPLLIGDWKTGQAKDNDCGDTTWQMALGGLAASKVYGIDDVVVTLLHIDTDKVFPRTAQLDVMELDAIEAEAREVVKAIKGPVTAPVPGPHCTDSYCPLLGKCSATQQALVQTMFGNDDVVSWLDTPENFAQAVDKIKIAKRLIEKMEKAMKAKTESIMPDGTVGYVPLHLPDGRVYGPSWRNQEVININDRARALELLREEYGTAHVDACLNISKKAIESVDDEAMDKLRAAGLVSKTKYPVFMAKKAPKKESGEAA